MSFRLILYSLAFILSFTFSKANAKSSAPLDQEESGDPQAAFITHGKINIHLLNENDNDNDNQERSKELNPLFKTDLLEIIFEQSGLHEVQEWLEEVIKLDLHYGHTIIFQAASDVDTPSNTLWSGSFDFYGKWAVFTNDQIGTGTLGFLVEGGQIIGHHRTEDLSVNIGLGHGTNEDFETLSISVTELWWEQSLFQDQLVITIGKISQTSFFDRNRIANDETKQFLATPFVNTNAVTWPGNGLGFNILYHLNDHIYITAGLGDASIELHEISDYTIERKDLFTATELGVTTSIMGRQGTYRFTLWHTNTDLGSATGFAISADQEITKKLIAFFRLGLDEHNDIVDFSQSAATGLGVEGPFGRTHDLVAAGFSWAHSNNNIADDTTLFEIFYRVQLTTIMQLTPHIQFIFDPSGSPDSGMVTVFGFRVQLGF